MKIILCPENDIEAKMLEYRSYADSRKVDSILHLDLRLEVPKTVKIVLEDGTLFFFATRDSSSTLPENLPANLVLE